MKDARAALDALREEERERRRQEAEEAERQRQIQLAQKLEVMRKKKAEYLEYQRQVTVFHRASAPGEFAHAHKETISLAAIERIPSIFEYQRPEERSFH